MCTTFYTDYCFEAGNEDDKQLVGRYEFSMELPDEEYLELCQVWDAEDAVNSWSCEWKGHKELFEKINNTALYALNTMLKEGNSGIKEVSYYDVLWELALKSLSEVENLYTKPAKLVRLYCKVGKIYSMKDKFVQARDCFDAAYDLQKKIIEEELGEEEDYLVIAENYQNEGFFHRKAGDYSHAIPCYKKAAELLEKNLGLDNTLTANAYYLLGLAHMEDWWDDEVMEDLTEALYYLQKPSPLGWFEEDYKPYS